MTFQELRTYASMFGIALALASCSGTDDKAASEQRVVNVDAVRKALRPLAEAECRWEFNCCSDNIRALTIGAFVTDASSCADRLLELAEQGFSQGANYNQIVPSPLLAIAPVGYGFDFSHVKIDGRAVAACAKSLESRACASEQSTDHCVPNPTPAATADPCDPRKILVGDRHSGEDCDLFGAANDVECAKGLRCLGIDGTHGVCVDEPRPGDPCYLDPECGPSLICDYQTGQCDKGADLGEPCSFSNPDKPEPGTEAVRCRTGLMCDTVTLKCADENCFAGNFCSYDSTCPDGTRCIANRCTSPLASGESCSNDTDCASGRCKQRLTGSVCMELVADGASCNQDADCQSGFCQCGQSLCVTLGVCQERVSPGEPCSGYFSAECAAGRCDMNSTGFACVATSGVACSTDADCGLGEMHCVDGQCHRLPYDDGVTCASAADCRSNGCVQGLCGALRGPGEPCEADGECLSGTTCVNVEGARRCMQYGSLDGFCTGPGP